MIKQSTAIKMALEAMGAERHKFAFEANLFAQGIVRSIETERAHQKYLRWTQAMEIVERWGSAQLQDGPAPPAPAPAPPAPAQPGPRQLDFGI